MFSKSKEKLSPIPDKVIEKILKTDISDSNTTKRKEKFLSEARDIITYEYLCLVKDDRAYLKRQIGFKIHPNSPQKDSKLVEFLQNADALGEFNTLINTTDDIIYDYLHEKISKFDFPKNDEGEIDYDKVLANVFKYISMYPFIFRIPLKIILFIEFLGFLINGGVILPKNK